MCRVIEHAARLVGDAERVTAQMQDEVVRETMLIATEGAQIGQGNGLSVLSMDTFSFGRPSRITATAHLGKGHIVDSEREVELGGPLHSTGVLILSGLLRGRYAQQ